MNMKANPMQATIIAGTTMSGQITTNASKKTTVEIRIMRGQITKSAKLIALA